MFREKKYTFLLPAGWKALILFSPLSSYLSFPFYFSFFRSLRWGPKGRMRLRKPEMDPPGRRWPLFLAPPRHSPLRASLMPPAPGAGTRGCQGGTSHRLGLFTSVFCHRASKLLPGRARRGLLCPLSAVAAGRGCPLSESRPPTAKLSRGARPEAPLLPCGERSRLPELPAAVSPPQLAALPT